MGGWRTDGLWGGLVALAVAGLCVVTAHRSRLNTSSTTRPSALLRHPAPLADVVIVGIDDASLAALGPWPWSRDIHARLIDRPSAAGAQNRCTPPAFTQPQSDRGWPICAKIRDTLSASTETTPLTAELGRVVERQKPRWTEMRF